MFRVFFSNSPYRTSTRNHWMGAAFAFLALMNTMPASRAETPQAQIHAGGPPPEAIAACASKPLAAPCYFQEGQRTIGGTCENKREGVVCVPDKPPPGPPGGPTESGARAGDRNQEGIATFGGPAGNRRPDPSDHPPTQDRRPPPPRGAGPQPPPEAFEACGLASEGSGCVVRTPKGDIGGTCALYQGRLACIPVRPPD